ncbi:hypothetical protein GpartN1_g3820.t1 [Galdieria partita]|uniref:Arrestin C-terminal-like domain-containing protein n=1 Tax=Galdieria partita TaxID=83374 RepID=A0A9C7PWV5_9RHOD|nr:hypothetical protein GpartN1_g3820.t1 [Galdieria partita]
MELDIVLTSSQESRRDIFCPGQNLKGNAIVRLAERTPLKQITLLLRGYENLKYFCDILEEGLDKENLDKDKSDHSQFSKQLMQQRVHSKSLCFLQKELILWDIKDYAKQRDSKRRADNNIVRRRAKDDNEINQIQGVLLLPFQFQLPDGLPPTVRAEGGDICIDYDLCLRVELDNDFLLKSEGEKNTIREKSHKLLMANDGKVLYKNSVFTKPYQKKASLIPKTKKKWFSKTISQEVIIKAGIPTVLYEETVGTLIPVTLAMINKSMKKVSSITLRQVQRRKIKYEDDRNFETTAYGPALYVNPNCNVLRKNNNTLGPIQSMLPLAVSLGPTVEGKTIQFTNFVQIEVVLDDRRSKIELELPVIILRGKHSPFLQRV